MRIPYLTKVLWLYAAIAVPRCVAIDNRTVPPEHASLLDKRSINGGVQLRILPLGASITYGLKSTDNNGYRYGLRNALIYGGNPVNMIGSVNEGTMADNQCEGWPGYTITEVASKAEQDLSSLPNLVLLHVGTNDCVQSIDIQDAGSRLGTLIDRLFDTIPGVTIIASTLLPNGNSNTQANINLFNPQIPNLIHDRQAAGKQITYVDFSSSYFSLSDIGSDGTHPTDAGYLKMAAVWYQGIQVAAAQGWISAPTNLIGVNDTVTGGNSTCNKIPGAAIGPVQTQKGSGSDDGAYVHIGSQVFGYSGFTNPAPVNYNNSYPEGVFFADIDGDSVDDYVYLGSNSQYGIGVALSKYGGGLGPYLYSYLNITCNRAGIHLVDVTGDGRDDFCCLGPDGGLECWENRVGNDPRSPNWVSMGLVKASEGYPQEQVVSSSKTRCTPITKYISFGENLVDLTRFLQRLADIDGDGRVDYVVFDSSGSNIYGWRNGALRPGRPQYWTPMNGVFSGLPSLALSGWRFVDLNGDSKSDLVWVSPNGSVTTWINRRGFSVGLGPAWVSHGITHQGSSYPVNVTFGAFMGTGRADYALVSVRNGLVYIDRWQNLDHGGTMVRGDGTFYCDMTGSGSDDYLFINATGAITLFQNYHNWGYWIPWGIIYNAQAPRQQIHLADFDADGKCDILLVDKVTGATDVILNKFANQNFAWQEIGIVTGSATCNTGYGNDKHDRGVRWTDLDADGRADFLCMQTDGVTTGYLNKGVGNMVNQGLIKHAEGKERSTLDLNGDGRSDLLYVNMINGSVTVWYNGGPIESSGSAFQWNWNGVVSTGGSSRGECVEFGQLYGDSRADYIVVEPASNKAWTYFNVCPDEGVGATTPNLPTGAPDPPQPLGGVPSGASVTKTTGTNAQGSPTTITATIVPVTTTNSKGSTFVTSSTLGGGSVITTTDSNSRVFTTTKTPAPTQTVITSTISSKTTYTTTSPVTQQTVITTTNSKGSTVVTTSQRTTNSVITSTVSSTSVVTTTVALSNSPVTQTQRTTVTTTDSKGVTHITTSTTVVTTSTPVPVSDQVTSTMTTVPPGFSIADFTDFRITGNIWVTTTGSDSSSTIVPVILPCATCEPEIIWRLPPIPNVEFQFPPFPKLSPFHLPCIKIFGVTIAGQCPSPSGPPPVNDGPPPSPQAYNPSPDPTSKPSTSCASSKTVTDFTYYVSYDVDTSGSTFSTTTYSSDVQTITACSATPTTTTVPATATCGGSGGCCFAWQYNSSPDFDPEAPQDYQRRMARAARITPGPRLEEEVHRLERRAVRRSSIFNGCTVTYPVTENDFPKVKDYGNDGIKDQAKSYFLVTSSAAVRQKNGPDQCFAPRIYSTNVIGQQINPTNVNTYVTTSPVVGPDRANPTPWVNSDHVFEVSNMQYFLSWMVKNPQAGTAGVTDLSAGNPNAVSCADFKAWWDSSISDVPNESRLKDLYSYMPGNNYPDFAAMDNYINGKKGVLWNPGSWTIPRGGANQIIAALNDYGMGVAAINLPDFVTLFQNSNQRIYAAFRAVDNAISDPCNVNEAPDGFSPNWADSYSSWMVTFIKTQGEAASRTASAAYVSLANLKPPSQSTAAVAATYPPQSFLFNSAALGAIDTDAPGLKMKRQACSRTTANPGSTGGSSPGSTVAPANPGSGSKSASAVTGTKQSSTTGSGPGSTGVTGTTTTTSTPSATINIAYQSASGCVVSVQNLAGCNGTGLLSGIETQQCGPAFGANQTYTVSTSLCSSATVYVHYDTTTGGYNTLDFVNSVYQHYWCYLGTHVDSTGKNGLGCFQVLSGTAPVTPRACAPAEDINGLCITGQNNQNSELLRAMLNTLDAGGDYTYATRVPMACTRSSSTAGTYLCVYWSTGSGSLNDATELLAQINVDGCGECGSASDDYGNVLSVDYSADVPCNIHNGVTTCTCDTLNDGHCIAAS